VRFSIGIEDEKDFVRDLEQAFENIDNAAKVKEDFKSEKYPQAY
jgi:hypothetical protein